MGKLISSDNPVGKIITLAGGVVPSGYLPCDGSSVSRTVYAALYAALGGAASPYGQGDGATTFNLPDSRGRALMGDGQGPGLALRTRGEKPGSETVPIEKANMPVHSHGGGDHLHITPTRWDSPSSPFSSGGTHTGITGQSIHTGTVSNSSYSGRTIADEGAGVRLGVIPPSLVVKRAIKY